jgi:C4-dicarboxylate-specific signal transduction histidine kinase
VLDVGSADSSDDLRRQQEHAQVSRELTASETAGALANELSQPLTAILASADALLRTYQRRATRDPQIQEAIEDVAREAFRAKEIVQRMRVLVRRRQARKEPLDVNEAIRSVATLIEAVAREHAVRLTFDLAPRVPTVVADRTQVQQVVLSLVRNACEAMSTSPPDTRALHVRTAMGKDMISVTVEDCGPRVDDDTLALLFVPFFTSKPEGLGIGLSLCRSIVEAHGGRIHVSRRAGRGLAVRFSLPAAV